MANDLAVIETQLTQLAPNFGQVLGAVMKPERLIRTVMISLERTPKLMQCTRESIISGAMTFAVLGLEVDGVTGQGYLIPFNDRKNNRSLAQAVIGYKGFNTLAARSGITITGGVVREGDEFDFDKGEGWVKHKPRLGGEKDRRVIAAWAKGSSRYRPSIIEVLSLDELLAIKARSPGAKYGGSENPWNDPNIGIFAMYEKSVKRRLSRSMPLNHMQLGAALDEAFEERGLHSFIQPDGKLMIEGEFSPLPDRQSSDDTPSADVMLSADRGPASMQPTPATGTPAAAGDPETTPQPTPAAGSSLRPIPDALSEYPAAKAYWARWRGELPGMTDVAKIRSLWSAEKDLRAKLDWPDVAGARPRDLAYIIGDRIAEIESRGD